MLLKLTDVKTEGRCCCHSCSQVERLPTRSLGFSREDCETEIQKTIDSTKCLLSSRLHLRNDQINTTLMKSSDVRISASLFHTWDGHTVIVIRRFFPFLFSSLVQDSAMNHQHSFIKSVSQLSMGSSGHSSEETAPLLGDGSEPAQYKANPLPKKQMFMIGLVTFIGGPIYCIKLFGQ